MYNETTFKENGYMIYNLIFKKTKQQSYIYNSTFISLHQIVQNIHCNYSESDTKIWYTLISYKFPFEILNAYLKKNCIKINKK